MTVKDFAAARRAGAPLVAIRTPDPAATMASIASSYNGTPPPIFSWDIARGLLAFNPPAREIRIPPSEETTDPAIMLKAIENLPERVIVFVQSLHKFLDPVVAQFLFNLRDVYKADHRTLVILCPDLTLPAEIANDVLILDEQLPDREQLAGIVNDAHQGAELPAPDAQDLGRQVDALAGLAAFPAEQAAAMSLTPAGMDLPRLWARKRQMIAQTRGLSCPEPKGGFTSLGGLESIKGYLRRLIDGPRRPKVVVLIDELDKGMAGAAGGSLDGGVSQDALQVVLTRMQERDYLGTLWPGVPGAGKSALAQATASEAACPLIWFDLGACRGSLVGESEQHIRNAFRVIDAVGQDAVLIVATCNRMSGLPPELKRRFQLGTFFFDLPTTEERAAIWPIYRAAYAIDSADAQPGDEGWTGAEIRACCMTAHLLRSTLSDAASYIVPVCRSGREAIDRLRREADRTYLSASYPGLYLVDVPNVAQSTARRRIELEGGQL